jgi:hypothetical protein
VRVEQLSSADPGPAPGSVAAVPIVITGDVRTDIVALVTLGRDLQQAVAQPALLVVAMACTNLSTVSATIATSLFAIYTIFR